MTIASKKRDMSRNCVFVLLVLLFSTLAEAVQQDSRIIIRIEEPISGETYSGVSNLRGWAISPEGMGGYYLNVFIDGQEAFYVYPYGKRQDVGNAYPDYPGSDTGGFSTAFNYKNLSPGEHEITVRAYDNAGNYNDATATFTAERFASSFISKDSAVDLSTAEDISLYGTRGLMVKGATLEGEKWDFVLKWDKPSQSFKTQRIVRSEGGEQSVYICATSPTRDHYSSALLVYFKNDLVVVNNTGETWYPSEEHLVFKTLDSNWYSIVEDRELRRLDVQEEPTGCFNPGYGEVVGVRTSTDGGKILSLSGEPGGVAVLDAYVPSSCPMSVGTPWRYYETGIPSRTYLVDLDYADTCRISDAVEL